MKMTKAKAQKLHKDMMAGLAREHRAGVTSTSEYTRLKKRAMQLHRADMAAFGR